MFLPLEYRSTKRKIFHEKLVRDKIFNKLDNNLRYLLNKRFKWMSQYISTKEKPTIIELGSGSGCIKKILKENIILTDIIKYDWIDLKLDMSKVNLGEEYFNKVDFFVINHALHHCVNPSRCLKQLSKYLRKGGLILINEPETSFFLKLIQLITKDEGWSYNKNIFDTELDQLESEDPWFSNTATGELLFKDVEKFNKEFPEYSLIKNELSEFLIFINSGGVNTNLFKIPLNDFFLNLLNYIDVILIKIFPGVFALNRKIVLKKF